MASAPLEGLAHGECYRALCARDARFDGRFFTCVRSTGIYCRPICPARTPARAQCEFVASAAAAEALGYRPCLRCRPGAAPGIAVARGTHNTVARALALIAEGQLRSGALEPFAERLGVGARQLRRLFEQKLGASPVAVAQTQRLAFAARLLAETPLPVSSVASAAGFGSVRRFNAAFQRSYALPPSALRRRAPNRRGGAELSLQLHYAPPFDLAALFAFLAARAVPGVELGGPACYARAFAVAGATGSLRVTPVPGAARLVAEIRVSELRALAAVVARLRRVLDLDADLATIDAALAQSAELAESVRARPGVRVPGAWDPFELAVRALLGQQVSVAAATTLAGRLVARFGAELAEAVRAPGLPTRLFPSAQALAEADLAGLGLPAARTRALIELSRAVAHTPDLLSPAGTLTESVARLRTLPGVGEWTAHYIAMRALGEPDAFPRGDLGIARALARGGVRPSPREVERRAEPFRPFRAYAAMRIWLG